MFLGYNLRRGHTEHMQRTTFQISGMHCANCAARIEKSLAEADGVTTAVVNFATEELTVEFDGARLTPDAIMAKVKELGYEARALGGAGELRFGVKGLHCASCVATL